MGEKNKDQKSKGVVYIFRILIILISFILVIFGRFLKED